MMESTGSTFLSGVPSTLLFDLSADCISTLTSLLPYTDVTSLLLSGNTLLRSKIAVLREIHVQLESLQTFPIHVFNYPQLRTLCINTNTTDLYGIQRDDPYYVIDEELVKPHNTLSKLDLHGYLVFTILAPSDTRKPLGELLPNLTSLKLAGLSPLEERHFQHIPSTLTELSLTPKHSNSLPLGLVNLLPRTLGSFTLGQSSFHLRESAPEMISFPPALTSLTIGCDNLDTIVKTLPPTLLSFNCRLDLPEAYDSLKVSSLPPSLNSLIVSKGIVFHEEHLDIILDKPFPSSLHTLLLDMKPIVRLFTDSKASTELTTLNGVLPPSLTAFSGIKSLHAATDWYTTTPLLQHCTLCPKMFATDKLPSKLPPLRTLNLRDYINSEGIDIMMPCTLTMLSASVQDSPEWLNAIAKLTQLQVLNLASSTAPLPSNGFWDLMKTRLTCLDTEIAHFKSIEDLQHGWKKLQTLTFTTLTHRHLHEDLAVGLESYKPAHPDTSECKEFHFPSTLTKLTLYVYTHCDIFIRTFANIDHLDTLRLMIKDKDFGPEKAYRAISSLTSSLTFLFLDLHHAPVSQLLKALPRKLKALKSRWSLKEDDIRTDQALDFPPNLVLLDVHSPDHTLDWDIGAYLPKVLDIPYTTMPLSSKAAEEVVRQQTLAQWI